MTKILIVEDDRKLLSAISGWLSAENLQIDSTGNGLEAFKMLTAS